MQLSCRRQWQELLIVNTNVSTKSPMFYFLSI
uniref:Uncharacterized protein n=1 Tax=Arundo donax TaxID=35708 RepID=A0A0A8Z0T4_ARUDO